jgi:hypothetical protein
MQVDGGFEFNGWYGFDRSPGNNRHFGYERWLPPGQCDIVALGKRNRR